MHELLAEIPDQAPKIPVPIQFERDLKVLGNRLESRELGWWEFVIDVSASVKRRFPQTPEK